MVHTLRAHSFCASHHFVATSQEPYSVQINLIKRGLIHHLLVEYHLSAGLKSPSGFRDKHNDESYLDKVRAREFPLGIGGSSRVRHEPDSIQKPTDTRNW